MEGKKVTEVPRLGYCRGNRVPIHHLRSYHIRWCGVTVVVRQCPTMSHLTIRKKQQTSREIIKHIRDCAKHFLAR
ncbi:hypothetical protein DPMN_152262 [Dreissena polymorpha]|uniref:Uncharacterized protein n=1 Tax=Dreissena polymorpha TaxID=45954 RepID=A0A9D4FLH5_DREPO|nr:hypothetical protein DPMN_152262 [Dreissena polymorpha]